MISCALENTRNQRTILNISRMQVRFQTFALEWKKYYLRFSKFEHPFPSHINIVSVSKYQNVTVETKSLG